MWRTVSLRKVQKKPEKDIVHTNTRLTLDPFPQAPETPGGLGGSSRGTGQVGPDGKEIMPSDGPQVNGYGFVATPSPAPGMCRQDFGWIMMNFIQLTNSLYNDLKIYLKFKINICDNQYDTLDTNWEELGDVQNFIFSTFIYKIALFYFWYIHQIFCLILFSVQLSNFGFIIAYILLSEQVRDAVIDSMLD